MTEQSASTVPSAPDVSTLRIGVLGGTGEQGRGLARRLALAGQSIVVGSRDAGRAAAAAAEIAGHCLAVAEQVRRTL